MRRPRLRPWMLVSAVWIAPAVFAAIDDVAQRRLHGDPPASLRELVWSAGDWLIYAFLAPAVFWLANRWPIARPHIARRVATHLLIALFFCVAWATGGKLLQLTLGLVFNAEQVRAFIRGAGDQFWPRVASDVLSWIFTTLPFGIVVYATVAGMAHAIRYFVEAREREVQMARLSEQLAGARLSALQAQLNPHFLFNTLNTIAVRARDGDGPGTARIVEQLSDVLRRTLRRDQAPEVPLGEELELVRQYVAIEEARFADRLHVTFDVDESVIPAAVPSFALQHLVENAIRHGIAKRTAAGKVRIKARKHHIADGGDILEVTVTDDGPGIDPSMPSPPGHGIETTRERLRALYGPHASLVVARATPEGTVAALRIPYRDLALESNVAER